MLYQPLTRTKAYIFLHLQILFLGSKYKPEFIYFFLYSDRISGVKENDFQCASLCSVVFNAKNAEKFPEYIFFNCKRIYCEISLRKLTAQRRTSEQSTVLQLLKMWSGVVDHGHRNLRISSIT